MVKLENASPYIRLPKIRFNVVFPLCSVVESLVHALVLVFYSGETHNGLTLTLNCKNYPL